MSENKISVGIYEYGPLLSKEGIEAFGVKALDDLNMKIDCVILASALQSP